MSISTMRAVFLKIKIKKTILHESRRCEKVIALFQVKYTEMCEVRSFSFRYKALRLLTESSSSTTLTLKFGYLEMDSDLGSNLCHHFSPEAFKEDFREAHK